MTSLGDRLRALAGTAPGDDRRGADTASTLPTTTAADAARTLGGEVRERDRRTFVVVDRAYPVDGLHGRMRIGDGAAFASRLCEDFPLLAGPVAGRDGQSCSTPSILEAHDADRLLYLDLETTGLAGGAGTHAFLIGCAWFEDDALRTRQYLMTGFADELLMLDVVADDLREVGALVTYNGKTFDVPVLEMRYQFHRRPSPLGRLAHLDMLHVARRLWRGEEDEAAGTTASCSLGVLEGTLCGVRRAGDVPGFEIPSRYFQFVRTGDANPLEVVLEHNRLDLLSLATLTARALRLVRAGPEGAETARECFGLGRLFERAGRVEPALGCYARAGGLLTGAAPPEVGGLACAEALRSYATICRRQRRFTEAAAAWRRVLELGRCPPHVRREANEALAIHCEHRAGDLEAARRFALGAMLPGLGGRQCDAIRHRLARLDRKMSTQRADSLGSPWIANES